MASSLQYLPPISLTTPKQSLKPPPAYYNTTAGSRRASNPDIKACSTTRSQGRRKSPESDDYHATLRALNSKGRFPRKSLGQHFMVNSEVNEQLAVAADVGEGDLVLEIGPGTGSLTNVLINSGAYVLAIEKDPHMAAVISERLANTGRLKVLNEDILRCHVRSHIESMLESTESLHINSRYAKVVANIPFNISTDIVKQLLPMGDIFSEVILLLQEETAMRLVESSLGTPEYRLINIFVDFYSDPELKLKVPRTDFFPQPNVDAAIVKFRLKRAEDCPSVTSAKSFFSMVSSAFNGKRKMLRRSLQHIRPSLEIEDALGNIGLPTTSRPGELTLDDFVKLHNVLNEKPDSKLRPSDAPE